MNKGSNIKISAGAPFPLGATMDEKGVNFAIFVAKPAKVELCLFSPDGIQLLDTFPLKEKTGDVWHIHLEELSLPVAYGYRVNDSECLMDPYAKEITAGIEWGKAGTAYNPLGLLINSQQFDWQDDRPPELPPDELVIYEMHVRGFTRDPSSKTANPGTYQGIIEKIPYLLELGVNAVELMPVHEFNECEVKIKNPETGLLLENYWGYSTVNFYTPMKRFASKAAPGIAVNEFKEMVKALHANGIEVYLDVVYNHTAEGDDRGPTYSYKALANNVYYMLDKAGDYINISGCGDTFNANQPVVIDLIIDSLRYWVTEMHVDGFRFDLAAALTRGGHGELLHHAPLIAAITEDPILANVKLFSEPWDAQGLYMVGNFCRESMRWSEWNGRYRDCVRKFIAGVPGIKGDFITKICGSQDLYHDRSPLNSVNFVTVHDGFTLRDLVSYNQKHNLANGEQNRDGTSQNDSWNCGVEGETTDIEINKLRERQMRNFYFTLLISRGTPLLHMGDEYGHTKKGNNNTWCHDGPINWFQWDELKNNQGLFQFCKGLIHFRKKTPLLHQKKFLNPEDAEWHGKLPNQPDWDSHNHLVAFTLLDHNGIHDIFIAFNAKNGQETIHLPKVNEGTKWYWVVNTGNESPEDFFEVPVVVESEIVVMERYSTLLLIRDSAQDNVLSG